MATVYVPPAIGEQLIEEIAEKGIAEVWFNPGAESAALVAKATRAGIRPICRPAASSAIGHEPVAVLIYSAKPSSCPGRSARTLDSSPRPSSRPRTDRRTRTVNPTTHRSAPMPQSSNHKRQGSGRGGAARPPQPDVGPGGRSRHSPPQPEGRRSGLNISELKDMSIQKLTQIAKELQRRRRDRHAQAGADLPDPEGADRAERLHLLGRRARSAARRLRVPARARLQLPARPRRHLRLALADSQVRSADRRHRLGPDSAAEGRRALLRADQGRSGQLRGAGSGARQAVLREPDAALSAGAHQARDRDRQPVGARHGSDDADRQGAARPDRRAAAHRQDDAAAEHRAVGGEESSRGLPDRPAHRRAARRSHRHAALGRRRGRSRRPSTSRRSATCRSPRW